MSRRGIRRTLRDVGVRRPRRDDRLLLISAFAIGVMTPRGVALAGMAVAGIVLGAWVFILWIQFQFEYGRLAGDSE